MATYRSKKYADKFEKASINKKDIGNAIKSFKILSGKKNFSEDKEEKEFPNKKQILSEVLENMKLQVLCSSKCFEMGVVGVGGRQKI